MGTTLARKIKAGKLREATKITRKQGHEVIEAIRGEQTIADINLVFQNLIHWPAILENYVDPQAGMLSKLYYAKPISWDTSIPQPAVKKIASIMLDTNLPAIAITQQERLEAPINQKAIQKDIWREQNVYELATLFNDWDQQTFEIAEYIAPHKILIEALGNPKMKQLIDQVSGACSE